MGEKRSSPRKKKRLIVDFETTDAKTTGFTHDVSRSGLFVRTIRIPRIGKILKAILHLPDGKSVSIEGMVVRSIRAPGLLRSLVPSGFGLRLNPLRSQDYALWSASIEDKARSA